MPADWPPSNLLQNNQLSGTLPSTIGLLQNVLRLDMQQNFLTGQIPSQIAGLQSALSIYLDNNRLQGQIPYTVGNLSALQVASHANLSLPTVV